MKSWLTLFIFVLLLSSCIKDRLTPSSTPVSGSSTPVNTGTRNLIYYWNFTDSTALLTPYYNRPGAANTVINIPNNGASPDTWDLTSPGTAFNAQLNQTDTSSCLRVRNPSTYMVINMPTTGYKNVIFAYTAVRTSKGAATNVISYTTDGTNFINTGIDTTTFSLNLDNSASSFSIFTVNFSKNPDSSSINNNPKFAIKVALPGVSTATSGNDRFDNITLFGDSLK